MRTRRTHTGAVTPGIVTELGSVPAVLRHSKLTPWPDVASMSAKTAPGSALSRTMTPALAHGSVF